MLVLAVVLRHISCLLEKTLAGASALITRRGYHRGLLKKTDHWLEIEPLAGERGLANMKI